MSTQTESKINTNNTSNDTNDKLQLLEKKISVLYQKGLLTKYFIDNNILSYKIVEADTKYYDLNLEQRQQILGANTTKVLCKTIILENKSFDKEKESAYYKRYYMCIVQYTNEFNAEKIIKVLRKRQNDNCEEKLSKKYFHFRLSKEEVAFDMSGYYFNCITPFLMKCSDMEILFPQNLLKIYPYYFWVGGGEVELKVGISVEDFFKLFNKQIIVGDILTDSE